MGKYRNLIILSLSVFILSIGQQMWFGFAPNFLRALGAGTLFIGLFASLQEFLRALYHYPGGWLNDRFGLRLTLVLANLAAALGYGIYLVSPHFAVVLLGLPFVMLWPATAQPAAAKLLCNSLPLRDRLGGAALHTLVERLPGLIAPIAGGVLILFLSVEAGVRIGLGITILAAGLTLLLQGFGYTATPTQSTFIPPWRLFAELPDGLKRMLVGEVLVGYAAALPRAFVAIYAIETLGAPYWGLGLMLAAEALVAVIVNAPLRWVGAAVGLKPVLIAAYLTTAIFPIAVLLAPSWVWLLGGFLIAGLQAGGTSAREVVLASLTKTDTRGQQIGLYESSLSLLILPAGIIGALLWVFVGPWLTFVLALFAGLIGCFVYAAIGPAIRIRE